MTRTDFLKLPESDQLESISRNGEMVLNFLQGSRNITVYKLVNLLIRVTIVQSKLSVDIINESDMSKLFTPQV